MLFKQIMKLDIDFALACLVTTLGKRSVGRHLWFQARENRLELKVDQPEKKLPSTRCRCNLAQCDLSAIRSDEFRIKINAKKI